MFMAHDPSPNSVLSYITYYTTEDDTLQHQLQLIDFSQHEQQWQWKNMRSRLCDFLDNIIPINVAELTGFFCNITMVHLMLVQSQGF